MQVKEIKKTGLTHELEVTVPANDLEKMADAKLAEVGKTIRMPGFRPGKVPLDVLKKKYGKSIMGEVLEGAVNETSNKAIKDKNLQPALQPKIEVKSFEEGKDLIYTLSVEVLPTFKVAEIKGTKLTKPVAKADDKAIMEALTRIASSRKGSEIVTTGRAAKKGDLVKIDFHGRTAHDNKEHPGMHMHGHMLEIGSGQFIPGFEDQLIGAKAGSKVEVKVKFPEKYGAQELAGKDAIFDVDVIEIHEPKEASIDDEFAKGFGMDDLAALKKAVGEQIEKEFGEHSRMKVKKALLDILDEKNKFEVPQGMLDLEYNNITQQIEQDRKHQGLETKMTDDEQKELKDIAERRVRLGLILSEVGKANNLQVSDIELQKAVITEAQKYPGQEKAVFEYFSKNRNALEGLRAPIFEDKVVDYLLELADVSEKNVTPEELTADDEDDTPYSSDASGEKAKKAPAKKKKASE